MFYGFIIWIALCFGVSSYARSKDVSPVAGFILSFCLSPLIGFFMMMMMDNRKTCPKCAEKIKAKAVVCKHCQHSFELQNEVPKVA